jgi:hypothetical protein
MRQENDTRSRRSANAARFLLWDTAGQFDLTSSEGDWVLSPIQCFDKAVEGIPGITVVRFGETEIPKREILLELCAALKHNRHTRKTPLLALLPAKHRKLMEGLKRAGVDFVKFMAEETLSSSSVAEIIDGLGAIDRVENQSQGVCTYLHYENIEAHHELTVCGAYLDRMVLGGTYLREICHTEKHLQCDYFLNPRISS